MEIFTNQQIIGKTYIRCKRHVYLTVYALSNIFYKEIIKII